VAQRILPSNAGESYSPAPLELKEIPEELRAISIWRKKREEEDAREAEERMRARQAAAEAEGAPPPDKAEAGGAALGGAAVEPAGAEAPPAGEAKEEEAEEEEAEEEEAAPRPHHPDFEPITKSEKTIRGPFLPLTSSPEVGPDGAYTIVTEQERAAEEEAEQSAAQQRETLLAEARTQADRMRKEAKEQGYQQGHAEGLAQAREEIIAELKPVLEEFIRTNQGLLNYRGEILQAAEEEIFELALLIGTKILHTELRMHPEVILSVVRHVLDRAVGWGESVVHVNPEDRSLIEEHLAELNEAAEGVSVIRLEADPAISRGSCVLHSNFGEVDARLERQHDEIEAALRAAMERKSAEEEAAAVRGAPPEAAAGEEPEAGAEAAAGAEAVPGEAPEEPPARPFQLPDLGGEAAPPEEEEEEGTP